MQTKKEKEMLVFADATIAIEPLTTELPSNEEEDALSENKVEGQRHFNQGNIMACLRLYNEIYPGGTLNKYVEMSKKGLCRGVSYAYSLMCYNRQESSWWLAYEEFCKLRAIKKKRSKRKLASFLEKFDGRDEAHKNWQQLASRFFVEHSHNKDKINTVGAWLHLVLEVICFFQKEFRPDKAAEKLNPLIPNNTSNQKLYCENFAGNFSNIPNRELEKFFSKEMAENSICLLKYRNDDKHATAFRADGKGGFYFFDPEFFEIKIKNSREFAELIRKMQLKYYASAEELKDNNQGSLCIVYLSPTPFDGKISKELHDAYIKLNFDNLISFRGYETIKESLQANHEFSLEVAKKAIQAKTNNENGRIFRIMLKFAAMVSILILFCAVLVILCSPVDLFYLTVIAVAVSAAVGGMIIMPSIIIPVQIHQGKVELSEVQKLLCTESKKTPAQSSVDTLSSTESSTSKTLKSTVSVCLSESKYALHNNTQLTDVVIIPSADVSQANSDAKPTH